MEELELTDIINIIKKRKLVLILFALVSVILTTIYLLRVSPIYQATTKVLIESKPPKTISIEDILVQDSSDNQFFKTQYSLFQSRSLIKKLLVKLDLLKSKEFNPLPLINFAPLKNWLKSTLVNIGIIQKKRAENTQTDPYSPLIDSFLDRLKVAPLEESKMVSIEFQGFSPVLTAKITNTLVDLYVTEQVEYKKTLEANANRWLENQGIELSKGLKFSNSKVQKFIENENMVELDGKRNFTNQQYRGTLEEASKVQAKIIKLKSLTQQIESFKGSPIKLFDSIPESLKDESISQLRQFYLDENLKLKNLSRFMGKSHPDINKITKKIEAIEASIPEEVDRLLRSLKADVRAKQNQEQELKLLLSKQKAKLMELDRKTIEFNQMEQEAKANKTILDQLLTRGKELGVYSDYYVPPIRIVDRAEVSTKPIAPKVGLYLILALSFGIFGGLILVFLLEAIDNTIKNEADANHQLPYHLLGSVGVYEKNGRLNSSNGNALMFKREFQNLRTKILPLFPENQSKVFIVTSTYPGEGKTTVTSNLAISLGEVGKKVVIIDADIDKPKIHATFKTKKTPGVINILSNPSFIKLAPVKTKCPGVWVLPAGELSNELSSSPDVLFSLYLPPLLDELKKIFDVVLIKAAPVLCNPHARIIEKYCDGILFVMASGMSDKKTIQNMVDQLASTPVEIKKRQVHNGERDRIPELPGEANSNQKFFRIVLTKVKDKKEEVYGYE